MTGRLIGKRAVVTGAASGIGRATALRFVQEGASVALVDVDQGGLQGLHEQIDRAGGTSLIVQCDVADEAAVEAAVAEVEMGLGGIDTLVANAAVQLHAEEAPVDQLDLAAWSRTLSVNLTGVFLTCKHGIRALLRNGGGSVIVTGSPTGLRGATFTPAYAASKGGVLALMRVMAKDFGPKGIRVNAVVPGYTETPLVQGRVDDSAVARIVDSTPLRRPGRPDEVAAVMAFLASDDASFVSGALYSCDGGRLAI